MLEEVREAGAARPLVLRADVEPLVDVDDRQLAVDVQDDLQAVRQRVLLELDLRDVVAPEDAADGGFWAAPRANTAAASKTGKLLVSFKADSFSEKRGQIY